MCTIGAMIYGDQTFMLKNFDYGPSPTGWTVFETFNGGYPHFALVDHDQRGVNSGLNITGLGLLISRSKKPEEPTPEQMELRTVLNAEVLTRFSDVAEAAAHVEAYARAHPEMFGCNVMLADARHISVTEYFGGKTRSQISEAGFLARANHSVFGVVENVAENSVARYARMAGFLEDLYPQLSDLDRETGIARCKTVLRETPILNPNTRSSFVMDIQERRVDYKIGDGAWQTFRFTDLPDAESSPASFA